MKTVLKELKVFPVCELPAEIFGRGFSQSGDLRLERISGMHSSVSVHTSDGRDYSMNELKLASTYRYDYGQIAQPRGQEGLKRIGGRIKDRLSLLGNPPAGIVLIYDNLADTSSDIECRLYTKD